MGEKATDFWGVELYKKNQMIRWDFWSPAPSVSLGFLQSKYPIGFIFLRPMFTLFFVDIHFF